tara:strand:+ start:7963 stop:8829 length:867 start_codon:yes stop_codon:yes gene_type:complete
MSNIFVNTVPHSGTHLVTTILDSLGYKHANIKNKFYTVRPYFRRIQKAGINWRSSKELGNYIPLFEKKTVLVSVASPRLVKPSLMTKTFSNVGNKQYIIGHMPFSADGKKVIEEKISKTVTIIRDPRDMAISMINHCRTRPLHHAHEYLFNALDSETDRLSAVVSGYDNQFGSLIGINKMYTSMMKWQDEVDNITLKFEDLVGLRGGGNSEDQIFSINALINYLGLEDKFDQDKISIIAKNSFGVSGTFRKGKIGAWAKVFSDTDKKIFKSKVGDLLIDLNYETNKDW